MRKKLSDLLCEFHLETNGHICDGCGDRSAEKTCVEIADYLIAKGVTFAADHGVGGNRIPYSARKEIYTHALFAFGQQAQMVVAIEELSEVQKELCKVMRGKGDMNHLAEEIADATIMLEQMRYFLGLNEQVCRIMDEKIQRLDDTLAKEGVEAQC